MDTTAANVRATKVTPFMTSSSTDRISRRYQGRVFVRPKHTTGAQRITRKVARCFPSDELGGMYRRVAFKVRVSPLHLLPMSLKSGGMHEKSDHRLARARPFRGRSAGRESSGARPSHGVDGVRARCWRVRPLGKRRRPTR